MGLLPDGLAQGIPNRPLGADRNAANIESVDDKPDFTIGEALKEKVFWIIALGHGASAMHTSTMMVHLILALKDQGLS